MYVRLAFAVAAHLEPEILIIDEVLAVGDAAFQKKCLGKMGEVAARGRTVLFVSHNMAAVRQLCDRALLVDLGRVTFDGDADRAIDKYLDFNSAREPVVSGEALRKASNVFNPGGVEYFRCAEIALLDSRQQPQGQFKSDEEITVAIAFECLQSVPKLNIVVEVTSESSEVLLRSERFDAIPALGEGALGPGMYRTLCTFPADLFGERHFSLSVYFLYHGVHHVGFQKVLGFDILFQGYHFSAESVSGRTRSYLRPRLEWKTLAEKG
jgi:lipopolysaccharide transport system ATP-binding protein